MVVFEQGAPSKSLYRKYTIKSVTGQDDFASMEEMLARRLARLTLDRDPQPGQEGPRHPNGDMLPANPQSPLAPPGDAPSRSSAPGADDRKIPAAPCSGPCGGSSRRRGRRLKRYRQEALRSFAVGPGGDYSRDVGRKRSRSRRKPIQGARGRPPAGLYEGAGQPSAPSRTDGRMTPEATVSVVFEAHPASLTANLFAVAAGRDKLAGI